MGLTDKYSEFSYCNIRFAVILQEHPFCVNEGKQIAHHLKNKGFDVSVFSEFEAFAENIFNYDCAIVLNPVFQPAPLLKNNIIWVGIQTEQFCIEGYGGMYYKWNTRMMKNKLPSYHIMYEFSHFNYQYLLNYCQENKIDTYIKFFEPICEGVSNKLSFENQHPKYDVFFVGYIPDKLDRRQLILDYLANHFNVFPNTSGLWKDDLQDAIFNSKVCLNLHSGETLAFELHRFETYFSAGSFVISENIEDSYPYIDGKDFVSSSLKELESKISYYLSHDNERNAIAKNAFERYSSLDTFASKVDKIIKDVTIFNYERYSKEALFKNKSAFEKLKLHLKNSDRLLNAYERFKRDKL